MPRAAPHICGYPGCSELVYSGAYCEAHQQREESHSPSWREYDKRRGSPSVRGYGLKWKKMRDSFLEENPWCVGFPAGIHGRGFVKAEHVDHVLAKRNGGTDEIENLQPLCKACHNRKTVIDVKGSG